MRKILVVLLTVAMIGLFGNAFAKIGLNIHGGWNALMPMGDFADVNTFSFLGFGGGATINITPMIGVDADFTYQLDIPYSDDANMNDDAKFSMMYINAGPRINLITGGAFVPFAGGGFGYYMSKADPGVEGLDTVSDNNIGFYFGGGIDYYFTPVIGIEAGAKFHYVMSGDDEDDGGMLQEDEGGSMMFLTFGAGISFVAM